MNLVKDVDVMYPQHWEMYDKLANFSQHERYMGKLSFPSPFRMSIPFMVMIQYLRKEVNRPVFFHCTYEENGHSPGSMHKQKVCAVGDGHIKNMPLVEECRLLVDMGFDGVGAYPYSWASKGFHADMRSMYGKPTVYWIEDERKTGEYKYFTNSDEFLSELGDIESAKENY